MLDLVLLVAFLVVNFVIMRWLGRQLVIESVWLKDPKLRKEIFSRPGIEFLSPLWPLNERAVRLLGCVVAIGLIIWMDYLTIRDLWPWLLGG